MRDGSRWRYLWSRWGQGMGKLIGFQGVLCFGLKEEKLEQMSFHFILPRRERAASAWDMVDCMKESTCRRDVGGGEGGHWVWEAVCGGEALWGICGGGGCAGHHMEAPVVVSVSMRWRVCICNPSRVIMFGGASGIESGVICRGCFFVLRVLRGGSGGSGRVRKNGWTFSVAGFSR